MSTNTENIYALLSFGFCDLNCVVSCDAGLAAPATCAWRCFPCRCGHYWRLCHPARHPARRPARHPACHPARHPARRPARRPARPPARRPACRHYHHFQSHLESLYRLLRKSGSGHLRLQHTESLPHLAYRTLSDFPRQSAPQSADRQPLQQSARKRGCLGWKRTA
jgi:hypothetical protein